MEAGKTGRKWTPGPWAISTENDVCTQIDGEHHAICTDQFCYSPDDEKKANAHLIAAAPDLYEALDKVNRWFNGAETEIGMILRDAVIALRKARGEV